MAIRALASYVMTYKTGETEELAIEVETDANYSPDLASDLAARAKATLIAAVRETWPPVEVK